MRNLIILMSIFLVACTSTAQQLQQGKTHFEEKNYPTAFKDLKPLAEKGNADAQYAVGYMYFYGKGTPANKSAAKEWIGKAAAQGQSQAVKANDLINKPAVTTSPIAETTQ